MKLNIQNYNGRVTHDYSPQRPAMVVPKIAEEKVDDGERIYITTDGRRFNADTFDKNFKVKRGEIKDKKYKGEFIFIPGQ